MRTLKTHWFASLLLLMLGLPLVWSLWGAVLSGLNGDAWRALIHHPQTGRALVMTLWTGLASTTLAVASAAFVLSRHFGYPRWQYLVRLLAPLLAVPHAAFAIGLAFLLAPSGWLLRAFSPWATGLDAPPPWLTTQDPWGLGLIAALALKETPFLLWAAATQLQRAEVKQTWTRELLLARSLGYPAITAWWRVIWPQLWPRLRWPLLAVLGYSLTVVDMALVIGPTSPPTLAVLAWQWLLDSDVSINAQGTAIAWLLTAVLTLIAGAAALIWQVPQRAFWRARWTVGVCHLAQGATNAKPPKARKRSVGFFILVCIYGAVILALAVGSISGIWPFPKLLPENLSWQAWASVWGSTATLGTTVTLAFWSAAGALVWSVAWLECAPATWDRRLRPLFYLPLLLPSVLWVVGIHGLALRWGVDATWMGVWLAHTLAATPYVLIALSPAYTGFDPRYRHISASLGQGQMVFLWRVKWPLLRAALASGFAIGFAVSVAQYLPTLFVGAGRFATVTTEAVTLAASAQRTLTSAYAGLQGCLPLLVWGLAAYLGQPRRFEKPDNQGS